MVDLERLKIIGTSHISEESREEVDSAISSGRFDVICVELDKQRLYALKNDIKQVHGIKSIGMIRHVGIMGFIFALVASAAQKKLGKKVSSKPGAEMLAAVESAAKNNLQIALIDQDVQITLRKLSKKVGFKEKMRILYDLMKSMIGMRSPLTDISEDEFDLKQVPSDQLIEKILKKTKKRYKGLYHVLVQDRNNIMAHRILKMMENEPEKNFLVVIGAGHKEGMLQKIEKKTGQRYDEHVKKRKEEVTQDGSFSFSFTHDDA